MRTCSCEFGRGSRSSSLLSSNHFFSAARLLVALCREMHLAQCGAAFDALLPETPGADLLRASRSRVPPRECRPRNRRELRAGTPRAESACFHGALRDGHSRRPRRSPRTPGPLRRKAAPRESRMAREASPASLVNRAPVRKGESKELAPPARVRPQATVRALRKRRPGAIRAPARSRAQLQASRSSPCFFSLKRTAMVRTVYTAQVVLASQPTTAESASPSVAPCFRASWY